MDVDVGVGVSMVLDVDPSTSTQPTSSTGDGPSAAPSISAQSPPTMNFSPSGTLSSIAQLTPFMSACPSDDVASSTRKRYKVAPSPPPRPLHTCPLLRGVISSLLQPLLSVLIHPHPHFSRLCPIDHYTSAPLYEV